ncbi:anti-sigma factor [Microbacterium thalassium]|uniref:Anti-sigma K factor RskA C-terminal domain-containing protein n=1 Tax=Microbacterium thalassium TaxID=362649 RepID=A0A7X0FRY4_9MICO|nr:anti-sigma factor [Microbacterium thalassium]MBB6392603.1 hypothetical protein [Microbacterium thalassium]GLK23166.1 hypothetical protein GCM10017607_04840 [Microbacterium thalassium]
MSEEDPQQADDGGDAPAPEPAPTTSVIQAVSRRNWTRGLIGFAIAFLVLVGLGFGAARLNESWTRTPAEITLEQIETAPDERSVTAELVDGGTASVSWSDEVGAAVFVSDDLPRIGGDQVFVVWLTRSGSQTLDAEFTADRGHAIVELESTVEEGDEMAVTIEPAADVPGEPSGEPIVTIPTS